MPHPQVGSRIVVSDTFRNIAYMGINQARSALQHFITAEIRDGMVQLIQMGLASYPNYALPDDPDRLAAWNAIVAYPDRPGRRNRALNAIIGNGYSDFRYVYRMFGRSNISPLRNPNLSPMNFQQGNTPGCFAAAFVNAILSIGHSLCSTQDQATRLFNTVHAEYNSMSLVEHFSFTHHPGVTQLSMTGRTREDIVNDIINFFLGAAVGRRSVSVGVAPREWNYAYNGFNGSGAGHQIALIGYNYDSDVFDIVDSNDLITRGLASAVLRHFISVLGGDILMFETDSPNR